MPSLTNIYSSLKPGETHKGLMVQVGNAAFTTTLTTKTISTKMLSIVAALLTEGKAYANTDLMYADLATGVASGVFSVKRGAGTTSGLTFSYLFVGH